MVRRERMMRSKEVPFFFVVVLLFLLFWNQNWVQAWEFGDTSLVMGMRGIEPAVLQLQLKWLGFYSGDIDGIFGPMTREAVIQFQREKGLSDDGVVGPETKAVLPDLEEMTVELNQRDLLYLAQTITGEARGENLKGQIAVGAVVMNRVFDERFPDTIRDVVLEQGQFTSVWDGQINYYYSEASLQAAQLALLGYDPTGGAFFFYNPQIATERVWITSREVVARIGEHIFAY